MREKGREEKDKRKSSGRMGGGTRKGDWSSRQPSQARGARRDVQPDNGRHVIGKSAQERETGRHGREPGQSQVESVTH